MQKWGIGTNGYHKKSSVWLDEAPWWIFALESFADWVCRVVPNWNIPILKNKKITRDDEEYTFGEYYGTIKDLFCLYVHHPILEYVWSKTKTISVDLPWDKCKELFYHLDKDRWDEAERDGEEMRKEYGEPKSNI